MSGVLRNIANRFNFNSQSTEDDDYFLDNDYEYTDDESYDYAEEEEVDTANRPSFFNRKSSSEKTQTQKTGGFLNRKVVPIDSAREVEMEVCMIKPTSMDDSRTICDYLIQKKAVVLNMEGMNTDTAQRIIDFTLGAIYSMDGDLQMISQYIFIATPENVELSGDFQGSFQNMVAEKTVKPYAFGGMRFNG